jgi:Caspase domain
MSFERDTRSSGTSQSPGRTTQAMTPGKSTLTGALSGDVVQRKESPGGGNGAGPTQTPRDLVLDTGGSGATGTTPAGGGTGASPVTGGGPANPGGGANVAATVVGAAADTEYAFDSSFTPALVAALHANPNLSIDEVLEQISAGSLGTGTDNDGGLHHPTIVQYGQTAPSTAEGGANKKLAVLIANQNYVNINPLGTPIAEAGTMKTELVTRGYDANVHSDKSSADMGTLWSSMVGAANKGDDLVAFYGGHGAPEGLVGINHDFAPNPADIFSNAQVSGVVSSATGKGAHIRFVMDSCHSGAAVQAVREERQNELAAVATTLGDQLRVAAMTGLRQAKQRLLAHCHQRETTLRQLDQAIQQHQAAPPDPANATATATWNLILSALNGIRSRAPGAFDRAADRIWAEYVPLLNIVRMATHHAETPPPIGDYRTLGAQVNYLDDLWNSVSQPMERAAATAGAKAPAGAQTPATP